MKTFSTMMVGLVMLLVAGRAGGVGPSTVEPTVDVTGKWVGRWVAETSWGPSEAVGRLPRSGTIQMTFTQTGSQYSGNLLVTGPPWTSGPTQGMVSGNQVRVLQPTSVTGSFTVQGDTMSGELAMGGWSHVLGSTDPGVVAATLTRRSSDQEKH